jgi:hypothetical protein
MAAARCTPEWEEGKEGRAIKGGQRTIYFSSLLLRSLLGGLNLLRQQFEPQTAALVFLAAEIDPLYKLTTPPLSTMQNSLPVSLLLLSSHILYSISRM